MKIALVHDYLKEYGGAERVLEILHEMFPKAPIYTIFNRIDPNSEFARKFSKARIVESWFAKLPLAHKLISPLRFLLPLIWSGFNFSKYDLVISSASWAITKGFGGERKNQEEKGEQKGKRLVEICYCHTPPRYLYGYETSRNWKKHWYVRIYALIVNHFMRQYDFNRAQKVDWFIANSREVQQRIKKYYRRESVVINPPVEIPKFKVQNAKFKVSEEYFLTGGRLEASKNFDLIIKACNQLKLPLKVYGGGSQENNLRSIAGSTVEFLGRVSGEKRQELMAGCRAFIVAATDEDFGITPVEAMAAGRPVIAFRGGGYLETVIEGSPRGFTPRGKTGEFFDEPTVESLTKAIKHYNDIYQCSDFKSEDCRKQAQKFSKERFIKEITLFLDSRGFKS